MTVTFLISRLVVPGSTADDWSGKQQMRKISSSLAIGVHPWGVNVDYQNPSHQTQGARSLDNESPLREATPLPDFMHESGEPV
jgi:hypothetical protein